jgi:hypothetical protein
METRTYVRNPLVVEAVQVTPENIYEVAKWCGGEVHKDDMTVKQVEGPDIQVRHIKIEALHPKNKRQERANFDDWVLKSKQGFKVFEHTAFQNGFHEATGVEKDEAIQASKAS